MESAIASTGATTQHAHRPGPGTRHAATGPHRSIASPTTTTWAGTRVGGTDRQRCGATRCSRCYPCTTNASTGNGQSCHDANGSATRLAVHPTYTTTCTGGGLQQELWGLDADVGDTNAEDPGGLTGLLLFLVKAFLPGIIHLMQLEALLRCQFKIIHD